MKKLVTAILICSLSVGLFAQERLTREQILAMSTDQLSELPLEQLMEAVETLGVNSVDELFALIMNKNVSSASKEEENSFTSPLSSTVITRDEMRTYGVSTIEEAFRLIPGMIVSEKTNGVYDVQMRGLSNIPDNNMILYTENANILVMVDGRIAHNYATGIPFFETLPVSIEDIERIEVVRGATSALYGPNAVNGVVNIITQKPDAANCLVQGNLQVGNRTASADFGLRKSVNKVLALGLSGNYQIRYRQNGLLPFIPQDGYYVLNDNSLFSTSSTLSAEEYQNAIASGQLVDISNGADLSVEQISNLHTGSQNQDGSYSFLSAISVDANVYDNWKEPEVARRNTGVNGYITLTPSENLRFDVQGGYQYAFYATTPVGNEDIALRYRETKNGYVNLNAKIYGLSLTANYSGGPIDLAVGSHAFGMDKTHNFNAQVDYDFQVGPLGIRPGVSYQFVKFKDREPAYFDYGDGKGPIEMSGYWGYYSKGMNSAELKDVAPSVRFDLKTGNFRLIAAIRGDKTSIPDKWSLSWQLAANYLINDNNFIRLVYGRSFRSATLANTSSNFNWSRANGSNPRYIQFLGNEDADIMHIDNFEVGYRWKPSPKLLIDGEAFYSRSTDYGELKSSESNVVMSGDALSTVLAGVLSGAIGMDQISSYLGSNLYTKSYIKYDEMPFVVHQFGIGLNIDWIISPKLIAKVNANVQRTTIDNYYQYSQAEMIARQLTQSLTTLYDNERGVYPLATEVLTGAATAQAMGGSAMQYMQDCMGFTSIEEPLAKYKAMSKDEQDQYLAALLAAYNGGPAVEGVDRPLGIYYALKYNVRYDKMSDEYYLGTSVAEPYTTQDNYRHKAAPAVYGMLGLIYKPTEQWSLSAFANLLGKREYTTLFGTQKIDPRCTVNLKVGYKPVSSCEVFFNAHNLFNTNKQEFIYTDKIGGIYTVGVNFGI